MLRRPIVAAGLFGTLLALGVLSLLIAPARAYRPTAAPSAPPETADPPTCRQWLAHGIDRQLNWQAARRLAACRDEAPGDPGLSDAPARPAAPAPGLRVPPPLYGGVDADIILPDGTYPYVTQSEAMVAGRGATIVVNFNDTRNSTMCGSGTAYSSDSGATWHAGQPLCTGHGFAIGDAALTYSARYGRWYALNLDTGCGGQGSGAWYSSDGVTWTVGPCVHSNSQDDRPSIWSDNNPASPYYGTIYVSYNDFNLGGALMVERSTDGGITWLPPLAIQRAFIRDVQATGDVNGSGTVFVAALDEGTSAFSPRTNHMFRSTDGGATWTDSVMGPAFYPPGRSTDGYFAGMYPNPPGYFRYQGWGQPAAVGNVVHYAYSAGVQGSDPGNILYTRSTDNGTTWSTPIQLNTDTTTRAQWMPSLAATTSGGVFVGWYDERETTTCADPGVPSPCYRRWGRVSLDNGVSWQPDEMVGDTVAPLPSQPDPHAPPLYVGDYNYDSADGNTIYDTWTDGRMLVGGVAQQDQFVDQIVLVQGTPTPTVTGTPPTATPTITSVPTAPPTSTWSPTVSPTPPPAASPTVTRPAPTASPTVCPITFSDVSPSDPFYTYIRCLACRRILSGYTTSPPCAVGQMPCFNGGATITRGQVAKVVSNAAGFSDMIPSTQQTFTDVPYGSPFWVFIERLAEPGRGYISGYNTSPPCPAGTTPCFLPGNPVTRGQMAKINSNAAGYADVIPTTQQTFTDVPPTSPFWVFVERVGLHGVISGYSTSPPCPGGVPCFLPGNALTRSQAAKIVANTFYPNCQTPQR